MNSLFSKCFPISNLTSLNVLNHICKRSFSSTSVNPYINGSLFANIDVSNSILSRFLN